MRRYNPDPMFNDPPNERSLKEELKDAFFGISLIVAAMFIGYAIWFIFYS